VTIANDTTQPAEPTREVLTLRELAAWLRLSEDRVQRACAAGQIPGAGKLGGDRGAWRIHLPTLREAMASGSLVPGQGPPRKRGRRR
jgi:hypothetical protein